MSRLFYLRDMLLFHASIPITLAQSFVEWIVHIHHTL